MKNSFNQFVDLLGNYSYGVAYDLLNEYGYQDLDISKVIRSFKFSINFDFDYAEKILQNTSAKFKHTELYSNIRKNYDDLIAGKPEAIFSELIFSMTTQTSRDEYIDFIGRVYRYREALLKYLFLMTQGKKNVNMFSDEMSKRYQIKILNEKYNVHTHNLGAALTKYFKQHHADEHEVKRLMEILDSKKMLDLMNLRNASIIGHGFVGISQQDIEKCYGDIDDLLYEFKMCAGFLGLDLDYQKYDKWNNAVIVEAKNIDKFLEK